MMQRRTFIKTALGATMAAAMPGIPRFMYGATLPAKGFNDARDWFFEKRLGMFIHWGLYAIHGWQEQELWRKHVPKSEYEALRGQFNPERFNPDAWLDLAEQAGMKYLCFTTKHVDGFCMWDTKQTDYNVMKTPYGKDVLKMLAEACHRRKFPLCLYFSIADENQANYPKGGASPDPAKYMQFVKAQVRELCTNYGPIHGFWWDANLIKQKDASVNAMIRELQPAAVINNRGFDKGDFGTPEREFDKDVAVEFEQPTEACNSVGAESWGYRSNEDFYTDRYLMRSIDRYLARRGNYLLNVGPKADGTIPEESAAILRRIGAWYGKVKESFDAEPCSEMIVNRNVLLTRRGNTLYVHLYAEPTSEAVKLKPINILPTKATLLNDGRSVPFACDLVPSEHVDHKPVLRLRKLPVNEITGEVMVVKVEFAELPRKFGPAKGSDKTDIMKM